MCVYIMRRVSDVCEKRENVLLIISCVFSCSGTSRAISSLRPNDSKGCRTVSQVPSILTIIQTTLSSEALFISSFYQFS